MPTPLILTNARLIDPATGYDGPGALKIRDGRIEEVVRGASPAPGGGERVDCRGLPLAPGIVDMRVFVGEPGARHRESFRTAGSAAAVEVTGPQTSGFWCSSAVRMAPAGS